MAWLDWRTDHQIQQNISHWLRLGGPTGVLLAPLTGLDYTILANKDPLVSKLPVKTLI